MLRSRTRRRRGSLARLLLLAGCAVAPASLRAQGSLLTIVVDSSGRLLPGVEVTATTIGRVTRTDSAGQVLFGVLPAGKIDFTFRRLGYGTVAKMYTILNGIRDTIWIVLADQGVRLAAVEVTDDNSHPFMRGFEERRAKGIGVFITRAQIDKANTIEASDLFRAFPQVHLVPIGNGWGIRVPTNVNILQGPTL